MTDRLKRAAKFDSEHGCDTIGRCYVCMADFAASETSALTARLEAVEKENAELKDTLGFYADATCAGCLRLTTENAELRAEVERLREDVKKFRDSTESMVAAFDDRPEGEPEWITTETRNCALICAMEDLGWTEQAERRRNHEH